MKKRCSFALAIAVSFALPSIAHAQFLRGQREPPAGEDPVWYETGASHMARWTPADGPLASYVADLFMAKCYVFIAIGYDARGFWSAESEGLDDSDLYLRHTSFTGERLSSHYIGTDPESDPERDQSKRRAAMKQKIFAVAKGPLDVDTLRHDYTMTLPKHDEEGRIAKFTGWFAEIKKRDGALMRYAIVSSEFMCWQRSVWVAYTLAPPKKPTPKK